MWICNACGRPTVGSQGGRFPAPFRRPVRFGNLPDMVSAVWLEAQKCATAGAFTGAVMLCRKLLMHVAVEKGADDDKSFAFYIRYLDSEGWLPSQTGTERVTRLKKIASEANHLIVMMSAADCKQVFAFTALLLDLVYELPAKMAQT